MMNLMIDGGLPGARSIPYTSSEYAGGGRQTGRVDCCSPTIMESTTVASGPSSSGIGMRPYPPTDRACLGEVAVSPNRRIST